MSEMGREVSEAIASAFNREPSKSSTSVEEFDRQMARTFGREADADVALRAELVEAGLTESGARGVVMWLDDFGSASEVAVSAGAGFNGVQPGKVASLTYERAEAVLRRHRGSGIAEADAPLSESTTNLDKARTELVEAHGKRLRAPHSDHGFAQRMAEAHTKGEVEALKEWGVREGWSQEQLVQRIRESAQKVQGNSPRQSREPRTTVTTEGTKAPARRSVVSEAEFDAAFATDKAVAEAFGRQIKES
ncbi:hypothetical protein ACOCJ7_07135 [Knoellia sp. CPCC 206453]|uniref:hypothetical protein n=1 Tax=Knoellia pratensis TaxID=3404796 RepID=UPI00361A3DED